MTQANSASLHRIYDAIDDRVLSEKFLFAPDSGLVQLFDHRMLMMHGFSMAALRRELIERLGMDKTREMFTRIGYQQGMEDARSIGSCEGHDVHRNLALLPRLREMEGFVRNQAVDLMQVNPDTGEFWGDYYWQSSWEADIHLKQFGISGSPACWMMTGYACGATTAVMGRPILWREVECVAMGHARCRVIGQPLEECDDASEHLHFLQIEDFVAAPGARRRSPTAVPDGAPDAAPDAGKRTASGAEALASHDLPDMVGASASFNAAVHLLKRVAPTDATVLLKGESGVGKERFSKTLHAIGPRAGKPMISVNCAAIPAELVEAELFGVERGAFTGATAARPGRFERANGGTLFLDEISSLPLHAQGKLLRVLQEGEVERVGDVKVRPVDVRIVAAANCDLREEVRAGRFREDLFFRLNVFPIEIPPLRERREDIPLMVSVFVKRFSLRFGKQVRGITRRASEALWAYHWPGNVRELENLVERAVILVDDGASLDVQHLFSGGEEIRGKLFHPAPGGELAQVPANTASNRWPAAASGTAKATAADSSPAASEPHTTAATNTDPHTLSPRTLMQGLLASVGSLEQMEGLALDHALAQADGNISAAARLLQMGRSQFEYRLKKHQGR
ncbi:sigma-54-dependent Fis family transcriptional regulator [Parathalassolituus penaei]|uniref:Sigma 54-interacting transcriptional regulator n=1 Tax=Parathalassolituus penaei TaxID=2997323 RepID=A0A9X3EI57_9GAMM|nr:sigma-54-dependent Fis family transcriptional regulator [Parathalassolituus penaei]MCY0964696.1 sigma 54-interacting transcriptional regulator [Parathalassolituus penaei]